MSIRRRCRPALLAYNRDGALVSTVYMIPVEDLNPDTTFDDLSAPAGDVDHVDVYFNAGHPGVEECTRMLCSGTPRMARRG